MVSAGVSISCVSLTESLPHSIPQFSDSHKHLSSLSLAGTGSEEEEQVTSAKCIKGQAIMYVSPLMKREA